MSSILSRVVALLICFHYSAYAQTASEPTVDFRAVAPMREPASIRGAFQGGTMTFQWMNGALASPVGIGPDTKTFNYTMHNFRFGWLMNTPHWNGHPLDGAVELIGELSGSAIFEGAGSYLFGPSIHLRYNFTQPEWNFVPYVQIGGGLTFTDAHQDQSQRAIGQELEFTPQASLGFRYLVDSRWSIDAEFIYHHISNAGLADRNLGINALGGMVGFSYFFGAP